MCQNGNTIEMIKVPTWPIWFLALNHSGSDAGRSKTWRTNFCDLNDNGNIKKKSKFHCKKTRIELRTKFSEKIQDVFAPTSRRSPLLKLNSVSACALNA